MRLSAQFPAVTLCVLVGLAGCATPPAPVDPNAPHAPSAPNSLSALSAPNPPNAPSAPNASPVAAHQPSGAMPPVAAAPAAARARAAQQYEAADPRLGELPTLYTCAGREVAVGYVGTQARVTLAAEQAHLLPVSGFGGSRYQDPTEPGTWLQWDGAQPTLAWRGYLLGPCRVLKPLVSTFSANGHQPPWRLQADGAVIALHWPQPNGAPDEVEAVQVSPQWPLAVGQTVVLGIGAGATELTVLHRVCKDRITGLPYPFTAVVRKDGRTHEGCGGDTLSLLQQRTWHLADSPATLRFDPDGRLSGDTGCNVLQGHYRLQGEFLQIDHLAITRRACLGPAMAEQQALLRWLPKVVRHDVTDDASLVLLTSDGEAHVAH